MFGRPNTPSIQIEDDRAVELRFQNMRTLAEE